jgi:aspartate carbamoyltransferase regulatory subunit
MKDYRIKLIENGVVIDHIDAGKALKVMEILGISGDYPGVVTIAMNLPSKKMKKKDIVKVENRDLDEREINKIAIIAPHATINWIKDTKVSKKEVVILPEILVGVIRCPNPNCITNKKDEPVKTRFIMRAGRMKCSYCERTAPKEEVVNLV